MKRTKLVFLILILFGLVSSFVPPATTQVGTYTFHGSVGDQKILKVNTVDNASLNNLFGVNWTQILGFYVGEAYDVGAQWKSVITAVNFSTALEQYAGARYTTSNWYFTTGDFNSTPDRGNFSVFTFYNPKDLTSVVQNMYSLLGFNVSYVDAGWWLYHLPTPVDTYLQAITWQTGWEAVNNSMVHQAQVNETVNRFTWGELYKFKQNCTETWSYDPKSGDWIGYKIQNSAGATIYEFSAQISTIPGYNIPILMGFTMIGMLSVGYIVKRRIQNKF